MKEKILAVITFALLSVSPISESQNLAAPDCTTTEKIQFATTTRIPSGLNNEQVREAVMVSLGSSDVQLSWAKHIFEGQWFFEYEDNDVIYSGYAVRSHYLQIAVLMDKEEVRTIVCNSRNLKQSSRSIHRKVPGWKGTLDNNIRIAMGQAAEYYNQRSPTELDVPATTQLNHLDSLYHSGVLTDEEYQELKQRVIDK